MKPLVAWMKSNVTVVACLVAIVAILPASYLVSESWGSSIRGGQEKAAGKAWQDVANAKVDYAVPQFDPATPALTEKAFPNRARTEWYKATRESLASSSAAVFKRAEDFNRGVGPDAAAVGRTEHKPIVEGVFPGPDAEAEAQLKVELGEEAWNALPPEEKQGKVASRAKGMLQQRLYEAEDAFLGRRGHVNPYRRMLEEANAGGPLDPVRLLEEVAGLRTAEVQKIGRQRDLTREEQEKLLKLLQERRLGGYQARAAELSVYATLEVLPTDDRKGSAVRLDRFEAAEVDPYYFFIFQWDLWTLRDLFGAVRLANTGPDGRPLSVDRAVVKRVVSIQLSEPQGLLSGGTVGDFGERAAPTAAVPGMVPSDFSRSITGRAMGSWNTFYDLRHATMVCVVSSARLTEFLDSIERTNMMTVTGLRVGEVKVWDDLREGYYYGPEHVVRVTVDIESVWLRSWMSKYMPARVAAVLGAGGQPAGGDVATPTPAPAPTGAGRPTGRGVAPRGGGSGCGRAKVRKGAGDEGQGH